MIFMHVSAGGRIFATLDVAHRSFAAAVPFTVVSITIHVIAMISIYFPC